jgi:hypothetical protein
MTQEPNDNHTEVRRVVRMLERTVKMAEGASLTGAMSGGKEFAVRSYNATVQHLTNAGEVPPGLFASLPEDANLDSVGLASAQLAEYLRAGLPEPEEGGRGQAGAKLGDGNVFFNIGGLGDIGDLVREHLPEWLRGKRGEAEPKESEAEPAEGAAATQSAANPGAAARSGSEPRIARLSLPPQQARIEELRPERREQQPSQ